MALDPRTDLGKRVPLVGVHAPVFVRGDIKHKVAAAELALRHQLDDVVRVHRKGECPLVIDPAKAGLAEAHTGLPLHTAGRVDELILGNRKILGQAAALIDQDMRLELAHHRVAVHTLPRLGRFKREGDIVPKHIDFAVIRHQLAHALLDVGHKAHPRRLVGLTAATVGMLPVDK